MKIKARDIFIQYNDITNIDYFYRLCVTFIVHLLFFMSFNLSQRLFMDDKYKHNKNCNF